MRSSQNLSLHDSIVHARARELRGEGNLVWADVDGFPRPQEVFGYIPDIITNGNRNIISEVETSDTYNGQHTKDQLHAFDFASNYLLEVVVPEPLYIAARELILHVWGISVDLWRTFKG